MLKTFLAVVAAAALIPLSATAQDSNAQIGAMPEVEVVTTLGKFTLELYPDKAPKTVENFLAYVREGFYDGTVFHRVIDGFMVQGGGFSASMERKETRPAIENEAGNGLKNKAGTIAMARTGQPHSATAQFFINVADNASLDHKKPSGRGWGYAVFGKCVDGMDTIEKIKAVDTGNKGPYRDVPREPVLIKSMKILDSKQG